MHLIALINIALLFAALLCIFELVRKLGGRPALIVGITNLVGAIAAGYLLLLPGPGLTKAIAGGTALVFLVVAAIRIVQYARGKRKPPPPQPPPEYSGLPSGWRTDNERCEW